MAASTWWARAAVGRAHDAVAGLAGAARWRRRERRQRAAAAARTAPPGCTHPLHRHCLHPDPGRSLGASAWAGARGVEGRRHVP